MGRSSSGGWGRCWKSHWGSPSRRPPIPERLIDVPLESLPYVDEHFVDVAATAERTWEALVAWVGATGRNRRGRLLARRLGCVPSEASGEPGEIGSTIPGFIVTRSVPPAVLALMGEHRFS